MMKTRGVVILTALLLINLFSNCHPLSTAPQQRYELQGKVISVDRKLQSVTIAHQKIPDLMDAMTMPFKMKSDWAFEVIAPGDNVTATLIVEGERSWIEDPVITKPRVAQKDVTPLPAEHQPPDPVPDFTLRNQDNKVIHTSQYKGRALLLTFIYTRCPLPDYCILMSNNFAAINDKLNPELKSRAHLLSITIDPSHDTPEVLRDYGLRYNRNRTEDFKFWEFATGSDEQVRAVAEFFGLTYLPDGNQIMHSLRTILITPDGRMAKVYRGNEWAIDEVIKDLETVLEEQEASR
jgi:protein SCO1/2